jgi:hypothetical protein
LATSTDHTGETDLPSLHLLHERTFAGKPLQSFKVYNDPFGESELCVELAFADGQVACLCIGPGRPQIVSSEMCYEFKLNSSGPVELDTDGQLASGIAANSL